MKEQQPTYYDILGVDRRATSEEITKAYRQQALKTHPDKQPAEKREEAEAKFKELGKAYQTLSDTSTRLAYDASLISKVITKSASVQPDTFKSTFAAAQQQATRTTPGQQARPAGRAQTAREKAAAEVQAQREAARIKREKAAAKRKATMESAKLEREKVSAARSAARESAKMARDRAAVNTRAAAGAQSIMRQQAAAARSIFEAMKAEREMLEGKMRSARSTPRATEQPSSPRYGEASQSISDLMSALKEILKDGTKKDFSEVIEKYPFNKENSKQISFDRDNPVKVIDNEKGIELSLRKTDKGYELCPPLKGSFTIAMPSADGKGMDMISVKDGKVVDGVFANGSSKNKNLEEVRNSVLAQSLTSMPKSAGSVKPDRTPAVSRKGIATGRGA